MKQYTNSQLKTMINDATYELNNRYYEKEKMISEINLGDIFICPEQKTKHQLIFISNENYQGYGIFDMGTFEAEIVSQDFTEAVKAFLAAINYQKDFIIKI